MDTFTDAGVPKGCKVVSINVVGWDRATGYYNVVKNSSDDSIILITPKGTFGGITIELWYRTK